MNMAIDANVFSKGLDTVNSLAKIGANLTENKKEKPNNPPPEKKNFNETTNQPHTQTVEVKVGNPDQKEKPVIVQEKKETHVHKPYPDGRALTKEECEVEKLRIQTAFENEKAMREYNMLMDERARRERQERYDREREERERREEDRKKASRRASIIGYSLLGVGLLGAGYCVYSDYRNNNRAGLALQEPKASLKITYNGKNVNPNKPKNAIPAEGTVK